MNVRAKFKLKEQHCFYHNTETVQLVFEAVCADEVPENQRFHQYTPSGRLEMCVNNPPVVAAFELGKSYYLDFTEAPQA